MQATGFYSGTKSELKLESELPDGQRVKGNTSSYIIYLSIGKTYSVIQG